MLRKEILEKIERKLESDLDKVLSKNELSAADWDAVKKAMCIASMTNGYMDGEMLDEEWMSYGYYPGYSQSMGMHYNSPEMMSNGRMRSPVTGRYISNGMNGMSTRSSYSDGYSGHSIEDRMIMALEQQMDAAKTDYERSMVEKEIKRIRRGDM